LGVMDVRAHRDPEEFEALAGPLYRSDPVTHTLPITVLAGFFRDPSTEPVMLTVHRAGELYGAVFRTPPWPLVVSGLPGDAAPAAVEVLAGIDPDAPGVSGPRALAETFAHAWADHTGASVHEAMAMRMYELGELRAPVVSGSSRPATEADLPLMVAWRRAFQREAMGHEHLAESADRILRASLARGDRQELWADGDEIVSWAHASLPDAGMSRVGPVYTPPALRGRGYGSAVTAAVSKWARDAGADHVLLFTDLANPTSNSIYQKLGYRPVHDTCELEFTPAS
jgi:GNAT superfamily N-acetyltransferase